MLDLYVEFEKALEALEQRQINYALCGGLAVTFLAQPRFTEDIDILVSPDDCERCKAILQPLGFKFFSTPMRFDSDIVEVHKLTKIDPGDNDYIFLDVISAISPVAKEILANRIRLSWEDKQVWVVSREGLIKLKESSKRPKDRQDIDAERRIKLNLPKRPFQQTIQRVSQMRRLGLSLREAYDRQFHLPRWLARFEVLRNLPAADFPRQFPRDDLDALRAGIRKNWAAGSYPVIVDVAEKLPSDLLQQDHVLAAFIGAAREQLATHHP